MKDLSDPVVLIGQVIYDKLKDQSLPQAKIVPVRDVYTCIPIKILTACLVLTFHLRTVVQLARAFVKNCGVNSMAS